MIQEVTKGEKVQAETINQLIEAANGPQRPQGWFVNTPNGSLHNPQSNMGYQPSPPVPEMNFQAKYVAQWEMTSRSGEYDEIDTANPQKMGWDVLVGPDCTTILGYYAVDGIVVLGSENTMDVKLEDIIDRRDPQGFVRTGIYEKPSIKLAIWRSKSEKGSSRTDILAIQPSDLSEASDRIKTLYPADQDYKMLVDTLLASHDDRNITYQYSREMSLYKKDGDADMLSSTQKSIETGSLSGETFFQLYNFPTETNLKKYDDIDDKLSAYDILLRYTNISSNTSAYTLCYANLSAITMTDSELENATSSIQHNTRYGKGELELYKFHDDTYKKDNVLSSDQILLRTVEQGEAFAKLQYAPLSSVISGLSSNCISGDTNVYPFVEKSIETVSGDLGKFHRLYNWMGYSANESHVLSAAFGETRYFPFQDGIGIATDTANAAHILTRPRTNKDLHYDTYGIRIPKVGTGDITNDFREFILSAAGIDKDTITQWIIETIGTEQGEQALKDQLDDVYWPQGEDHNKCYGSSIGNSTKDTVIDLDGTKLQATGNNGMNLDWSSGHCYDSNGQQSIGWDGRGLMDANEDWTVDWNGCELLSPTNQTTTLDWDNSQLKGNWSVDQGNFTIGNGFLTIGNTTLTEAQLQQLLRLI